jgi:hypothetical protein
MQAAYLSVFTRNAISKPDRYSIHLKKPVKQGDDCNKYAKKP